MSTLKTLGVEKYTFTFSRQSEAIHQQQQLRITPFLNEENETYDWSNILAKPELVEIKPKHSQAILNSDTLHDDPLNDNQWQYAKQSLYIFDSDNPTRISLLKTFRSENYKNFMRIITLINIAAVCAYDYRSRIDNEDEERNRICITLEIACNIFFGIECLCEIIIQGLILEKNTYLRNWWNICNFITFISTWAVLGNINSQDQLIHILRVIRIFRTLRLIQDSKSLKKQMDAFIGSFSRLGPILIPLIFVTLYYSIIGLHLFMGITENRCRETPEPENGIWIADPELQYFCGIMDCPIDRYCGNPYDHHLPRNNSENISELLGFDIIKFDNFFNSLFSVFTLLAVTGWSGTTFMLWKAMTTYVTAFYFVSLIFILAYVLSNLLLASFYESFLVFSSIKQNKNLENEEAMENEIQKKNQQQMMTRLAQLNDQKQQKRKNKKKYQVSLFYDDHENNANPILEKFEQFQHVSTIIAKSTLFKYLNLIIIFISTIVIICDYDGISQENYNNLLIVDFICIIFFIVELVINIIGNGIMDYFKEFIDAFDFMIILSQIILLIVLFFLDENEILSQNKVVNFFKSLKILRLMKLLYTARMFYTISVLARCLVQTLIKIKDMLLLLILLILITSLFGQEFLANKVRFEVNEEGEFEVSHSNEGVSAKINYEGFGNSYMAATNIFYNEEWNVSMLQYGQQLWVSILYYLIAILLGQVLFVRLITAVFLNEFCKQLKKIELDLKPIDFVQYFKDIYNTIVQCIKRRKSSKIHSQNQISTKPINHGVQERFKKLSIFQDFRSPAVHLPESNYNEANEIKPQSPSNIFSNKESMIHQNKQPLRNIQQDEIQEEEQELQDHEVNSEQQKIEEQDEEQEQEKIKSPNTVQEQANKLHQGIRTSMRKSNSERTLFIFTPESDFRQLVTSLVQNLYFRIFNFALILLTCIRIGLLSPLEDPDSQLSYVLKIGYIFLTIFYILVILLNCIAFGLYKTEQSFFRQSIFNIFSFAITIVDLVTLIFEITHPLSNFLTSLRILQFIQIGAVFSKNIAYAQTSLLNAFAQMIQLAIFCFIILAIYGVFALKLLKGSLHYCNAFEKEYTQYIINEQDCYDYGGSWINQKLNYDTIFQSILTLFCTATTENWLPILENTWNAVDPHTQPIDNYNRYYAFYIQIFFFLGNLCLLNMFIGLVVNAYQEAKLKAQNLHLLDETQREWFQIKLQIYNMKPLVKSKKPINPIRRLLFFMVKQKYFKIFWLYLIFINTIVLAIQYHRSDPEYKETLDIINEVIVFIFTFEILCRFFAKDKNMYFKDISNIVDIIGIWWAIANIFLRNDESRNFYFRRIFNAFSVGYQMQRNYRIIKRFNDLEKLFSSIFSVIPNALSMLFIMFIFLFIYTALGIDLFAYIRTQEYLNGWDQHFRKFSTAMFTLIKVASSEGWWFLLVDTAHDQDADFACNYMNSYNDYKQYGFNGCGTVYAYLFFISFHLVFSLVIFNLLIAAILGAYEEHAKSEESAISKYQLNDVLSLWRNYDPEGKGLINYKDFWKLSSEIAIIFGVAQEDLLDVNNKKNFLKVLNIPIYESTESNMLCYKFHDVILSLTKISVTLKYGVTNLEPTDKVIQQKLQIQLGDQQNSNVGKFTATSFNSGDMVAIIYIQKKFRLWKKRVQVIREGGDVKAIYNEMSDLKNMIKKQLELEDQQGQTNN